MDAKKKVAIGIIAFLLVALIAIIIVAIACKWDVGGWLASPVAIILYVIVGACAIAGIAYLIRNWATGD